MDYKHVLSIIDNESEKFDSVITKTEKAMLSAAVNAIKKLDVDASGNIRTTTANIKLLATIRTKLATVASNKEFMSGVKSVANAMDKLYKAQVEYYSKAFPQKTLGENAKKKHQALQQIAISNVANGLSQSALTTSVVEPLNKMLLRAVTSGSKYADLIDEFHKQLESSDDSTSALAKYAKTYATTAMTQLAGENNRLFTDDLGAEWFQYVGSVIETSRQFCELLTEKEYIHKSEIKDILNGYIEIDGKVHECEINPKTGLPKGLIEGTTEDNFQVNVGGWNCRHQLIPISELMVPEHIRAKFDKGVNDNGIPIGLNAQIEQARELAKKWGLSVQLRVLDKRVETKDIPGIQSTITTINNKSNDLQEQYNNAIKNCKEWGISTSPLDTVMRNPTSADILNAINGLNNKCAQEQKEYNAYLVEAKNAIKDAKAKSVNCSEVVDDVYTVTEDKTQWVKGKVSFRQRLKNLFNLFNKNRQYNTSNLMPSKLSPESKYAKKYFKEEKYVFDKEFFDLLDPNKPIKLELTNSSSGSYSSFAGDLVHIASHTRSSLSKWESKAVIYHEYGHCIDVQRQLWLDSKLIDMRTKHIQSLNEIDEFVFYKRKWDYDNSCWKYERVRKKISRVKFIDEKLVEIQDRLYYMNEELFIKRGITKEDVMEQIISTRDAIKSLVVQYGAGHTDEYFAQPRMKETEYLAHAFENAFLGNAVFKKYLPDIYNDMVKYIKSLKPIQ